MFVLIVFDIFLKSFRLKIESNGYLSYFNVKKNLLFFIIFNNKIFFFNL